MPSSVPELSLADYVRGDPRTTEAFSAALMGGLQRYGFIALRGHPISSTLIDKAYALSAQLFAQPEDVKRRYAGGQRGYTPFRTEHAKNRAEPDLKEFWQIGPERAPDMTGICADGGGNQLRNIWPDFPPKFKETCLALFDGLQETGRIILEALAPALRLPPAFFEPLIRDRNSVLRLLHYPPVTADAGAAGARSAPHEDINLITLLLAPEGPGLELLDRDGRWFSVETQRGNLIVDSGDMLARMTNDVIPATTHRVVNPSAENVSRYSMPFFIHPDSDVILSCVPACIGGGAKYADIRAGTFLEQRLSDIGLIGAVDCHAGADR